MFNKCSLKRCVNDSYLYCRIIDVNIEIHHICANTTVLNVKSCCFSSALNKLRTAPDLNFFCFLFQDRYRKSFRKKAYYLKPLKRWQENSTKDEQRKSSITNLQAGELFDDFLNQGQYFCIRCSAGVGLSDYVKGTLHQFSGM